MPIYEYACRPCGEVFEQLILRKADEAEVRCPACASGDVSRRVSQPASRRGGAERGPRGACGPVG